MKRYRNLLMLIIGAAVCVLLILFLIRLGYSKISTNNAESPTTIKSELSSNQDEEFSTSLETEKIDEKPIDTEIEIAGKREGTSSDAENYSGTIEEGSEQIEVITKKGEIFFNNDESDGREGAGRQDEKEEAMNAQIVNDTGGESYLEPIDNEKYSTDNDSIQTMDNDELPIVEIEED